MRYYGDREYRVFGDIEIEGEVYVENVDSLPEWIDYDIGRIVYMSPHFYYSTNTEWQELGASHHAHDGTSGTAGASDISGTSGTSDISGTSGTSDISGTSGTSDISGTSGSSGGTGTSGTSGPSGTSGSSGIPGTSGEDNLGSSGTSGTSGTSGSSGTSGAGGGFVPSGTPLGHWSADTIIGLEDGDPVATWSDQTVNGNDFLQAEGVKQPLYQTNEINSLPCVRFDGANDFMLAATMGLTRPTTIFLVMKQITWTLNDSFFDSDQGIGKTLLRQSSSTPEIETTGGENGALAVGSWGVVTFVSNGPAPAECVIRVNGGSEVAGGACSFDMNGIYLGIAGNGVNWPCNFELAEMIAYDGAEGYEANEAGLAAKYGIFIPSGSPVAHWSAGTIGLNDSDAVASWVDQANSYNLVQAEAGKKPTYKTNILNGHPCVRFDGGDILEVDDVGTQYSTENFTIQIVANVTAETGGVVFGMCTGAADTLMYKTLELMYGCHLDPDKSYISSGNNVDYDTESWEENVPAGAFQDSFTRAGLALNLWRNGTLKTPDGVFTVNNIGNGDSFRVGGRNQLINNPFTGDIFEIIVYDSVLSTEDREANEAGLKAKYGLFIPSGSPIGHWSANTIEGLSDGDNVTTWLDQSGNSNDLTQGVGGSQPTYETNELNGLPMVKFDGVDFMQVALAGGALTQPFSIFVVAKWWAAPRYNYFLTDGDDAVNRAALYMNANTPVRWGIYAGVNLTWGGGNADQVARIWSCLFNGAASNCRISGTDEIGNAGTKVLDGFTIGAAQDGSAPARVMVAEVIIYDSNEPVTANEAGLAVKYGL